MRSLSGSKYSRQIAFSPSVTIKAAWPARSPAERSGASGAGLCRAGRCSGVREAPVGDTLDLEGEAALAPLGELDIDLGEELGIEQGAVLHPVGIVDPVARA